MTFQIHAPEYPLSQYVEFFWYQAGILNYSREIILPSVNIELIINLGKPHRVLDKHNPAQYDLHTAAWVAGMQTEHIVIESLDSHMIGVRFKPGGAAPFFPFPIFELTDRVISMEMLWGSFAAEAREKILAADTIQERFKTLEECLLTKLREDPHGLDVVQFATRQLIQSKENLSVDRLSNGLAISHKHLITQFKRLVGLTPKQFARTVRFNNTLNSIDPTKELDWARIAYQNKYYDQAHFNKEFIKFSGMTPTAYLEQRTAYLGESLQQGEDVQFVPIG